MRTFIVSALLIGAIFAAPAAQALSIDDIDAKVQALLAQIETLQKQLAQIVEQRQSALSDAQSVAARPACFRLDRILREGARGDDVLTLQQTLRDKGFFAGDPTGYFGALTRAAVERFQATQSIVSAGTPNTTGFGLVGPMTRRILWKCDDDVSGTMRFSAAPQRGAAPLEVTFKTWISGFRAPSDSYVIDFGDGTSEQAADCYAPADACIDAGLNTHTYTQDGTYTAILYHGIDPCAGNSYCKAAIHREAVAKVRISVGAVICTQEYAPVCGLKQVVCIKAPCNPVQQTYSNKCVLAADGATFLYSGECRPSTSCTPRPACLRNGTCEIDPPTPAGGWCPDGTNPADDPQCKIWFDGCNTCSRSTPGGPGMCTMMACMNTGDAPPQPYCKEYFSNTSGNKPPVISGVSGPTILAVGQTGTWSIKATDPENGTLSYSIRWGDESNSPSSILFGSAGAPASLQTSTFTHAYSRAGVYTVVVTVTDSAGAIATATVSVNVGTATTACTREYMPVCGRPQGCANTCPQGRYCTLECQLYPQQTYSNRCELDAAGATFEHTGSC